ncbi:hypothetical protein BJ165DRAFT_1474289 [Panaeolus papilionaceus]|nr:hypothetical protein BJ165DRAFT_1474289 [Panaeolus papilionaceus]
MSPLLRCRLQYDRDICGHSMFIFSECILHPIHTSISPIPSRHPLHMSFVRSSRQH